MTDDSENSPNENEMMLAVGLNYDSISKSSSFNALTRFTAQQIMKSGYLIIGDWLKALHGDDLQQLLNAGELVVHSYPPVLTDSLAILSIMLTIGEGNTGPMNNADFLENLRRMIMLVTAEALTRKGVAELDYSKVTLSEPLEASEIVKIIGQGVQFIQLQQKVQKPDSKFPMRKKSDE